MAAIATILKIYYVPSSEPKGLMLDMKYQDDL